MGSARDTAPSRRRGSPCRVLKEARTVTTPFAGLPLCTGLMVAAPCSDLGRRGHPPITAPSAFAAVAGNQSQELRCCGANQIQPRPPESGGFTPPSTPRNLGSDGHHPRRREGLQRRRGAPRAASGAPTVCFVACRQHAVGDPGVHGALAVARTLTKRQQTSHARLMALVWDPAA